MRLKIGKYTLGKLDLDGKDLTYGQRIALAEIFAPAEGVSEYTQLCNAFKELHGFSAKLLPLKARVRRIGEIVNGLQSWIEKEQQLLDYKPSADELAAGVEELGKKVGSMSTLKAIAKAYGKDPDDVLAWEYGKVFGILFTDLEERKFEERLMKQKEKKYAEHNNRRVYHNGVK